jgi:hypothetical protein
LNLEKKRIFLISNLFFVYVQDARGLDLCYGYNSARGCKRTAIDATTCKDQQSQISYGHFCCNWDATSGTHCLGTHPRYGNHYGGSEPQQTGVTEDGMIFGFFWQGVGSLFTAILPLCFCSRWRVFAGPFSRTAAEKFSSIVLFKSSRHGFFVSAHRHLI